MGVIAIVVAGGIVACLVVWRRSEVSPAAVEAFMEDGARRAEQMRVRLLCRTNHQGLLEAGREIFSEVAPRGDEAEGIGSFPISSGVSMPEAIRNLRPHAVVAASQGYLIIEMHGGMDHFGVNIYPDGYEPRRSSHKYGDRELISGLWYYDDGYLHNPDYDDGIDTLIEEHTANHRWENQP